MAQHQVKSAHALEKVDPVWARIRGEAEEIVRREPELASFIYSTILHHDTLEAAVVHRISERLDHPDVSAELIRQAYGDAIESEPASESRSAPTSSRSSIAIPPRIASSSRCSTSKASTPSRPIAWRIGCGARAARILRYYLQSRSSAVFQTDINPAAPIGQGIFLDHATGLVVGETAVIEDDVSILHDVTLGGTGKEKGDRHPKIRHGVMLGAGAKIIGNIEIGHCARVAAGSVVLKSVPHNTTVAGVPARVIGEAGCPEPSRTMDQLFQPMDF